MKPVAVTLPTLQVVVATHPTTGHPNLTDLWKAAGGPYNKRPVDWLRTEQGQKYVAQTAKKLKVGENHLYSTRAGKHGGTYAHKLVALEYARYLSAKLAVEVNQVFFDVYENPEATTARMMQGLMRRGMSEEQAGARIMGIGARKLFTATLGKAGVNGKGFGVCTRLIYTPLWGGSTEKIRARKGLPATAKVRDHMSVQELSALMLAESTAAGTIEAAGIKGLAKCAEVCDSVATAVAQMIMGQRQKFCPA